MEAIVIMVEAIAVVMLEALLVAFLIAIEPLAVYLAQFVAPRGVG